MKQLPIRSIAVALVLLPTLVAAAASVIALVTLAPRLPDPLAVHWGASGAVDRLDSLASTFVLSAVFGPALALVIATVFLLMTRHGAATLFTRAIVATGAGVGVLVGLIPLSFVVPQVDAASAASTPLASVTPALLAVFGIAALVATATAFGVPRREMPTTARPSVAALELAEGERAYWGRSVAPRRPVLAIPLTAFVVVTAVLIVAGAPWWVVVLVDALFVVVSTTLVWHVRVDQSGLHVVGALGFPRLIIPVSEVVSARAIEVAPMREYGGWGVRFSASGTWGVIVRGGHALEVERRGKAPFVVTVDDAQTAARLLTALVERTLA